MCSSEFCPGVPWKGLQNIDPENDPNMTPGSVPSGPTINTNIHDVNRYLLRDRNGGKNRGKATYVTLKRTWQFLCRQLSVSVLRDDLFRCMYIVSYVTVSTALYAFNYVNLALSN